MLEHKNGLGLILFPNVQASQMENVKKFIKTFTFYSFKWHLKVHKFQSFLSLIIKLYSSSTIPQLLKTKWQCYKTFSPLFGKQFCQNRTLLAKCSIWAVMAAACLQSGAAQGALVAFSWWTSTQVSSCNLATNNRLG